MTSEARRFVREANIVVSDLVMSSGARRGFVGAGLHRLAAHAPLAPDARRRCGRTIARDVGPSRDQSALGRMT
jgi:hypothetical protein